MTNSRPPKARQVPRLWDYPALIVPLLEIVALVYLIAAVVEDTSGTGTDAGFDSYFVFVPLVVALLFVFMLSFPLLFLRVTNFVGDVAFIVAGIVLPIVIELRAGGSSSLLALFSTVFAVVGLSLLLRRIIGYALWKKGKLPRKLRLTQDADNFPAETPARITNQSSNQAPPAPRPPS
ncbi:hypothetical protein [Corynebacterium sp. 20_84]